MIKPLNAGPDVVFGGVTVVHSPLVGTQEGILTYMGNASTAAAGPVAIGRNASTAGLAPSATAESRPPVSANMEGAGAGWYFDPEDQAIYRYWDGSAWTAHCSDTVLSEVPVLSPATGRSETPSNATS